MPARSTINRRRKVATLLADEPSLSNRELARRLGCHHDAIARDRRRLEEDAGRMAALVAPMPDGSQALTHGATGEQRVGPLRDQHDVALAADFPTLDSRRRRIVADRLARIDLALAYLDRMGIVRDQAKGTVYPVVMLLDKWESVVVRELSQFVDEARHGGRPPSPLAALGVDLERLSLEKRRELLALIDEATAEPMLEEAQVIE